MTNTLSYSLPSFILLISAIITYYHVQKRFKSLRADLQVAGEALITSTTRYREYNRGLDTFFCNIYNNGVYTIYQGKVFTTFDVTNRTKTIIKVITPDLPKQRVKKQGAVCFKICGKHDVDYFISIDALQTLHKILFKNVYTEEQIYKLCIKHSDWHISKKS